ncbi:protein 25-like lysozyme [Ruminiclostridium hungatei]|uniref:Protein 25-like lysozyme n=1 Tax=Ruminiclostridium hungatei TaxID=48256 RepID=A0A1V4SJ56_RUMHU|nr:DUF2634 domain-containing protein [Ruminiclostridium hungatei]OPX43834.1 protein 25-like lysozyme [Ruminiclostridium hungatei]
MIPFVYEDLQPDLEYVRQPSGTYRMHLEEKRIWGMLDGSEAIRQAIYKILNTERYDSVIYSWNYGAELVELVGQPVPYVYSQLERKITEALLRDDRITEVVDFSFSADKGRVTAAFTAVTTEGGIAVEKEVRL